MSALTLETVRTLADINNNEETRPSLTEYLSEKQDWNRSVLNRSHEIMLRARQTQHCYWIKTDYDKDIEEGVGYPQLTQIFSPPQMQCNGNNEMEEHSSSVAIIISVAIIVIVLIVVTLVYFRKRTKYINRLI